MGQTHSALNAALQTNPDASRQSHTPLSFLAELGTEHAYVASIGSGATRCLRAIKAKYSGKDGYAALLVVKVYLKPDAAFSLKGFAKRLKAQREALQDVPNIFAYARILETERAGYVIRQWIASSLYDRISTRPFLNLLEKKWIAFQLLTAVKDAQSVGIGHGDIKSENVLLTSSLWVYLADFSSAFKPVYLPLDDPWQFSYFFDSSARRTCYLAPERFVPVVTTKETELNGITEAMDIFSVGCVLAELFCDGVPPFSLSQLFSYRRGEYFAELQTYLKQIEDSEMTRMILTMLSLDPSKRETAASHLCNNAFPDYFPAIHSFLFASYNHAPVHSRPPINQSHSSTAPNVNALPNTKVMGSLNPVLPLPMTRSDPVLKSNADERIEAMINNWDEILGMLPTTSHKVSSTARDSSDASYFPLVLTNLPNCEIGMPDPAENLHVKIDDGPASLLLTQIAACIRNCIKPNSVLQALDMLLYLSLHLTDETNLDRLLPYVVDMLADDSAMVRNAACRTLTQLIILVEYITPSNASVFNDYILPNVKPLATDTEAYVRITFAQCLVPLAESGAKFISMAHCLKDSDRSRRDGDDFDENDEGSYDAKMSELHENIVELVIQLLLADPLSSVRRSLVNNIAPLCIFFGRETAADVLLSHMITFLNDRDWLLRAAFFESAVDIASCVGGQSVDDYILPLMTQALSDVEEAVTSRVLTSLSTLTQLGLVQSSAIWDLLPAAIGFICHPNQWIRQSAASFISSAATVFKPTDTWCILYPMLRRSLRADIAELTEVSILTHVLRPLPRKVFESAISWATKPGPRSNYWTPSHARQQTATGLLPVSMQKSADKERHLSEEDSAQLDKLRLLGLTTEDEIKLEALKDYVVKLVVARQIQNKEVSTDLLLGNVKLQNYGVTPQTIFFSNSPCRREEVGSPSIKAHISSRRPSMDPTRTSKPSLGVRNISDSSAVDDLRKRLALSAGPSSASISNLSNGNEDQQHTRSQPFAPIPEASSPSVGSTSSVPIFDASEETIRIRNKIDSRGVMVNKVSPAVAKDVTYALGKLNIEARHALDDESATAMSALSLAPSSLRNESCKIGTTYEGNDPQMRQLLERAYLDARKDLPPEFGELVFDGVPKRRALRSTHASRERASTGRPEGTLISHLAEHTAAINQIAVSPDAVYFASASDDGTVKVWDAMRLEKNVTAKSRFTIHLQAKVTALCHLQHLHCISCATESGDIQIHRLDVDLSASIPKYRRHELVRQYKFENNDFAVALLHYELESRSILLCATSSSKLLSFDIQTMQVISEITAPSHFGAFCCIALDPKKLWVAVCTSIGHVLLLDLRFGLLLKVLNINHSDEHKRHRRIHQCSIHPTRGKGRWLIMAADVHSSTQAPMEIWDISNGTLVEQFRQEAITKAAHIRQSSHMSMSDSPVKILPEIVVDKTANDAVNELFAKLQNAGHSQVDILSLGAQEGNSISAFVVGVDYGSQVSHRKAASQSNSTSTLGGTGELISHPGEHAPYVLTGGQDLKLRFWDLESISKSVVISSSDETRSTSYSSTSKTTDNVIQHVERSVLQDSQRHRSTLIASYQHSLLKAHQDSITAVAVLQLPFRCVVSGDRKGIIKVFL